MKSYLYLTREQRAKVDSDPEVVAARNIHASLAAIVTNIADTHRNALAAVTAAMDVWNNTRNEVIKRMFKKGELK